MKRIGLAVTDPLQIIATGLTTVKTHEALNYIVDYFNQEELDHFIIGDTLNLDGQENPVSKHLELFIQRLKKKFPKTNIVKVDEGYSSKMAFQTMIDSGLKKKARRNKALIDEISATLILQNYLETQHT